MVDIGAEDDSGQQTGAIDQYIDFTIGMSVDEAAAPPQQLYQQAGAANVIRRLERADSEPDSEPDHPDSNEYLDLRVRSLSTSPPTDLRLKGAADMVLAAPPPLTEKDSAEHQAYSAAAAANCFSALFYSTYKPGHASDIEFGGRVHFKQEDLKENNHHHHHHQVAAHHPTPAEQEVSEYLDIRRDGNFMVYKDLSKAAILTSLAPLTPANQQHEDAADNNNGEQYQEQHIPRAHQFQEQSASVATLEPASW